MSNERTPESIEVRQLGNLVAAAFDRAEAITSNPQQAARLAAFAVTQWLRRSGQLHLLRQLANDPEGRGAERTLSRRRGAALAA